MRTNGVLIAGAGPTGLTAAIELKRFGIPFRLIDKSEKAAQWSQALVVQARTLEQFERYGIADTAVKQGCRLRKASLISEGKTVLSFALDRIPGRYPFVLFLPQNDTERILTDHLRSLGGEIERGTELISVQNEEEGVTVNLRRHDGGEETESARWLIGCDGAHSKVRDESKIPFQGDQVALSFFLGDLELEGPDALEDELRVYFHRGDVVFIGRLNDRLSRVIVALHSQQGSEGNGRQPALEDFQQALDRAGIKLKVKTSTWMTPFRVSDRQAARYRLKSAFLAGDASHIHSPVGGQGMNTGIQDVANLAWKIAAAAHGAPDRLLDSYGEERGAVGKALLSRTSRVLSAATSANPFLETLRDALLHAGSKIPLVQEAIAGFVSETSIEYRGSSVVIDCGGPGELKAGDRMPNPDLHAGERTPLLAPLSDARPLVLAVDVPDEARLHERVPRANFLAMNSSTGAASAGRAMDAVLTRLVGKGGRILVVRPDGYIGFRGGLADFSKLAEYSQLTAIN
jgi:2-polyprenyl-6-methoxyphenol hydroxylase-like FAD-dependent oxidoreductase